MYLLTKFDWLIPSFLWTVLMFACGFSAPSWGQTSLPMTARRVCIAEVPQDIRTTFPTISLSYDGKQILVWRSKGQVSLFDYDDLIETSIPVDPRCIGVVTDPQRGGVLAILEGLDPKIPKGHFGRQSELQYYHDLNAFRDQQIGWTLSNVDTEFLDVSWIHGTKWTAVIDCTLTRSQFKSDIRILDHSGSVVVRFDLPGKVIGIEQAEHPKMLDIYFASASDNQEILSIKQAMIDLDSKKPNVSRVQMLYQLPVKEGGLASANTLLWRQGPFGNRTFRLRGSQPGDIRYFVVEVLAKSGFLSPVMYSHPRVASPEFSLFPRLSNFNIVASDQDPENYEFLTHWGANRHSHLDPLRALWKNADILLLTIWNRNGQEAHLDSNQLKHDFLHFILTDGIQFPDGVVATVSLGHNALGRGANEIPLYELSVLDIGQRAEKYQDK